VTPVFFLMPLSDFFFSYERSSLSFTLLREMTVRYLKFVFSLLHVSVFWTSSLYVPDLVRPSCAP